MAGKISKKQQEILDYIKSQIVSKGFPPSVREICEAVKLKSTSSVHAHLETLEKNGYIRRDPTHPRAIEITDETFGFMRQDVTNIPMVGFVAAGEPLLAEEHIESFMPMPVDRLPNADCFMLKVRGDSMINIGILDRDYVLVQSQKTANNGEVIVAIIDEGATCKRYFKENGVYRLQPENDDMEPIITDHLEVAGKVIGVMRFM